LASLWSNSIGEWRKRSPLERPYHCHPGCERKRQLYSADGQIFEWPIDNTNVRRDGFVDVDWLVKRGTHIADDHILVLRISELMLLAPFG
jgi:hypothetical protein